jgi:hypothetical protein
LTPAQAGRVIKEFNGGGLEDLGVVDVKIVSRGDSKDSQEERKLQSSGVNVFYSYSRKDEAFCDKLAEALALLKRQGLIVGWHDRRIGG